MNMVMLWQKTRRLCLSEVVFMREILFRAKAINRDKGYHRTNYKNGDWVYGLITRLYDERFENLPAEMTNENGVSGIEIDHNTICQFTGLKDKNGRKIWEGDVVRCTDTIGKVGWNETHLAYTILADMKGKMQYFYLDESLSNCTEVIGNIFDNADLLGE